MLHAQRSGLLRAVALVDLLADRTKGVLGKLRRATIFHPPSSSRFPESPFGAAKRLSLGVDRGGEENHSYTKE